jgi:branched-chain amino acid transport system permease protein
VQALLLFVLLGLGPGALIAGVALGVVLVYRSSGMINFATGVTAAWGAFVYYDLVTNGALLLPPIPFVPGRLSLGSHWAAAPAFVVAVLYCALLGLLLEVAVIRPLRTSSPLTKLLASLGVYLFLQSILTVRYGTQGQSAPPVLPAEPIRLLGVGIPVNRFILLGGVLVTTAVLIAVYRYTRFGLATRAAAEDESNAALFGLRPQRLSMINSVVAHALTGVLGILVAPLLTLDVSALPNLIIPALAAALLARFRSFGVAAGAGIAMGVIQSLITYAQAQTWFPTAGGQVLPGVTDLAYFVLVVVAMLWQGSKVVGRGEVAEKRLPEAPPPRRLLRPTIIAVAALVVAFLVLPYNWRQAGINTLIGILVCLSLVVIIGYVGQVSLVQLGLAGVSGFTVSKLAVGPGIGFPLAPILAVLLATAVGVAVAFVAVRVRGVNLAIVTLAAAIALQNFGFNNSVWGSGVNGSPVPSPSLFGVNLGPDAPFPVNNASQPSPVFGLLCGAVVIVACLFVSSLRRSRFGHRMLAVRSNERAAAAAGVNVVRVKLLAFAISSALAGLAGVLYAYNFQSVSSDRFGFYTALTTLAFAFIGGITTVRGAVLASVGVTGGIGALVVTGIGIPVSYQYLLGGLLLVLTLIAKPEGLASNKGLAPPPVLLVRGVRRLQDRLRASTGAAREVLVGSVPVTGGVAAHPANTVDNPSTHDETAQSAARQGPSR